MNRQDESLVERSDARFTGKRLKGSIGVVNYHDPKFFSVWLFQKDTLFFLTLLPCQ